MKILFVAGGSGGHILPALAVADYLRIHSPEIQIVFISSDTTLDGAVFAAHPFSYPRRELSAVKFRRYFSLQNILDFFRFPFVYLQASRLLKTEQPQVIFSKGGFVALPIGIAAKFQHIPFVIHESDTVSGLANRWLRKMAARVLTAFPGGTGMVVGMPVRSEIENGDAEKGRAFLGFPEGVPILLVMGGSQGAEALNQLLLHARPALEKELCIVHLAGNGKSQDKDGPRYRAFEYLGKEYPDVLAAATLVVARAGATTLFELIAARKPAILIPLPSAANDHQRRNAAFFQTREAAEVLQEEALTSAGFQNAILELLSDQKRQETLQQNLKSLQPEQPLEKIANILKGFL